MKKMQFERNRNVILLQDNEDILGTKMLNVLALHLVNNEGNVLNTIP